MKFEQNWLKGFRGGVIENDNGWTDRGMTDKKVITIAHPEYSSEELKTLLSCP